jgi:hypothetical protein
LQAKEGGEKAIKRIIVGAKNVDFRIAAKNH